MVSFLKSTLIVAAIFLTGCAATVQRAASTEAKLDTPAGAVKNIVLRVQGSPAAVSSADWELLRAEWRTAMSLAAANAAVGFVYQDGASTATSGAGTLVIVTVNDYRYVSPGARFGFGILTGNAFIDADVAFLELPASRPIGNRKYSTSSSAWQGVFSAMTGKQIEAISAEIIKEVAQR